MMTVQECIQYVESHLEIRPATDNGAYTSGRTIRPAGCVNHSVGCAQPSVDVFFNAMNKSSAGWGVNALLGDFHKGEGRIVLTLQWNGRPWGCGSGSKGSWNNTKVQWEICEPAGHTYAGGTMVDVENGRGMECLYGQEIRISDFWDQRSCRVISCRLWLQPWRRGTVVAEAWQEHGCSAEGSSGNSQWRNGG